MDIANFLLNIITLLLVVVIAFPKIDTAEKRKATVNRIKRKITKQKLGAIEKLTAEEQNKKGTRLEETEIAMDDLLKDMFGEGGAEEVYEAYKVEH